MMSKTFFHASCCFLAALLPSEILAMHGVDDSRSTIDKGTTHLIGSGTETTDRDALPHDEHALLT